MLGVPKGNIDMGMTLGSYLGIILLTGTFAAVGLLASAISQTQVTAYLLGVFICFILYFGIEQLASYKLLGTADYMLQNIGMYKHYMGFTRGLIDSRDVFYFLFLLALCLWLSVKFVTKKK